MELKNGYKQTEAGIIPEDWKVNQLDLLVDQNRPVRYGIVQPGKFDPNGRFMVRGQDYSFGWVDEINFFRVSQPVEERYKNARLAAGDIILTIVGAGVGNIEIVPKWLDGANITQTTARISFQKDKVDPIYCSYYLKCNSGKKQIALNIKGAAQPGLNIRDIKQFLIPLPPLKEQTAIAIALSDADAYITSLEKLIEKKREIKQGVMQELLKPKDGWASFKLKEISVIKKGQQLNKSTLSQEGDFPVMNGGVSPSGFTSQFNQNENTIIISEGGNSCGFVNFIKTKFWQGGHCYSIETRQHTEFLYHLLKFKEKEIMSLRVGSGLPNIQLKRLYTFQVSIPEKKLQIELAEILNSFDLEIKTLIEKLNKIKDLKQSMMQNLLQGKIRLI